MTHGTKGLLIAIALAFAPTTLAAPATPATPAAPAQAATAGLPGECIERLRAHAEKMKKELGLSEAQSAAIRNEMQRHHGLMMTARADHRSAIAKILTPEQLAKMEGKHAERRQKMMERCAGEDDMPKGMH